jgi:hypothetical protein
MLFTVGAAPKKRARSRNEATSGDVIGMSTVADEYCGIASIPGTVTSTTGETVRLTANLAGEENMWEARFHV